MCVSLSAISGINHERTKPLEQLATYCWFGETRYGYVVTQNELDVLQARRISKTDPTSEYQSAAVKYKEISWADHGPGMLTVNLAIWALGCTGINPIYFVTERPKHGPVDIMKRLS